MLNTHCMKMRFILAAILTVLISLPVSSLEVPEYFKKAWENDPAVSLTTMKPYEYVKTKDSRAPWGYKPFYISHYGRHGSRSGWAGTDHTRALFTLEKAHAAGQLTDDGELLLKTVAAVVKTHANMDGRLTPRGAREHSGIAKRMVKRFKRVFTKGHIRAVTSDVQRCIISMDAALGEIRIANPKLEISADVGLGFQKYVSSSNYDACRDRAKELRDSVDAAHEIPAEQFLARVFKDPEAVKDLLEDPLRFRRSVWITISAAPGMDIPYKETFHIFSPEEAYYYMNGNAYYHYLFQANSIPFGAARMARLELLVNDILDKADDVIACGRTGSDRVVADLRYGHDWTLIALESYLGFEGAAERYDAANAYEKWNTGEYSPFAGNVQIIFYRACSKRKPVLVKFLMNEQEVAVIGLEPYKGKYYRWDEFKEYISHRTPVKMLAQLEGTACKTGEDYKTKLQSYQGMDIWGDYMLSCQNGGYASIYKLDTDATGALHKDRICKLGEFALGSCDRLNHSNVATFFNKYYKEDDPLPLVGISLCNKERKDGLKDQLFVERIDPDFKGSSLITTINYDDARGDFGYALQWVYDRAENILYGYGNTVSNKGQGNNHRIIAFHMPDIGPGCPEIINLKASDAIENYLIEDTYPEMPDDVGQGLFVQDGLLYLPVGVGRPTDPSILNVWNLRERRMEKVLDLSYETEGEFEDVSVRDGSLYIQANNKESGLLMRMPLDFEGRN